MYPHNGHGSPGVGHFGHPVYYPLSGSHLINTPYLQQQPLSLQVYQQQQHQQYLQQQQQQQQFYQQLYQYQPHQHHYLQHAHCAPGSPLRIQSPPLQIQSHPPRFQSPPLQTQPPSTHFSRISSPPPSSPLVSRVSAISPTPNCASPAASFFARAAQKLGKKKKRHQQQPEPVLPSFPTKFSEVLKLSCLPYPPCLLQSFGRSQPLDKVKVMLRVVANNHHEDQSSSFLNIDTWNKQLTVYDPAASGHVMSAAHRKATVAPKMYAFDGVFSPDDSLTEVCSGSLTEIIQGVVAGADGCVFTYGYSKLGKTYTMIGEDVSSQTLGLIPCAIVWLFKVISEQKDETGARFSVRVSAVEVSGKQEVLKDLLADVAQGTETGVGTAPGMYLREDPISGTQLENQSELRAPTAEKAAFYLDAALNARTKSEEERRSSHLLFTLYVYQYRIEKENRAGLPGVAGGRSRLHLIDLGSASKSKDPDSLALSLSALGNVIMAHLNGQRHVPHRDSKVAQLLRHSLGNVTCHTCMIALVSQEISHYNESLQVIQLAARIHRMRRRKVRGQFSGTSSDDSSTSDGSYIQCGPYRGFRMGTLHEGSSLSDPDYTSSSESCNTVIYLGNNGQSLSDRELTDHERQPRAVPRTNPRLPRRASGSRSSGDEGSNSDSGRSLYRSPDSITRLIPSVSSSPVRDVSVTGSRQDTVIRSQSTCTVPIQDVQTKDVNSLVSVSPQSGSFGLPQKINIPRKTISGKQDRVSTQCYASVNIIEKDPAIAIRSKRTSPGGKHEQWIDGPGAAIYQKRQNSGEQWIDGPSAFIVKQDDKLDKSNMKMSCEEMWVDGPPEMLAKNQINENQNCSPNMVMHTSLKKAHVQTLPSSTKQQSPINSPALHWSENVATKLARQMPEIKERSENAISTDSGISNLARPGISRPNIMLTNVGDDEDLRNSDSKVKPFVTNWIERHCVADSEINLLMENNENVIGITESASGIDRRTKLQDCRTKKLNPSLSTPKHSYHHYQKNSPSMARKSRPSTTKLSKPNIPTTSSTSKLVTDWLKSVESNEEEETVDMETKHSVMESDIFADKLDSAADNMDACENISSCRSVHPNTTLNDSKSNDIYTDIDVSLNKICDTSSDCLIVDTSFDSSVDTTNSGGQNHNSIYEFQMDKQLENELETISKKGDDDDDDDDTYSTASGAKDCDVDNNEQLCETKTEINKSETIQSMKTLVGDHVYSDVIRDDSKCDDGCNIDVKQKQKLYLEPACLLLSRKPDGASNPNLISETFSDDTTVSALHVEHSIVNVKSSQASDSTKKGPVGLSYRLGYSDGTIYEQNKLVETELVSLLPQKPCSKCGYSQENSKPIAKMCKHCQKMVALSIKNSHSSVTRKDTSKYGVNLPSSSSASPPKPALAKDSKSNHQQSPDHSKLPVFSEHLQVSSKDLKPSHTSDCKMSDFLSFAHQSQDSDSGNDGGVASIERTLLSPYATVTKPRTVSHSSSGHGSDNSSTMSADLISKQGYSCSPSDKQHGGTSSGYESMLKDSDGSGSSTIYEDSAEESSGDKQKGVKKKSLPNTHWSKSFPGRSSESPESLSHKSIPSSKNSSLSPTSKVWQEKQGRQNDERPMEIQEYNAEDVSRMTRMHRVDEEALKKNHEKLKDSLTNGHQEQEIPHRKDTYIEDHNHWSFDYLDDVQQASYHSLSRYGYHQV